MAIQDYQGRPIRLPDERWTHILARHPEMGELLQYIADTLRQPGEVADSATDPDTVKLCFRQFPGTGLGNSWVLVIVKYLEDDAFILTPYTTDRSRHAG